MNYQVCEPLTADEFAALKADISERGVMVPVEVDENGDTLDGHHRILAWAELRAEGIDVPDYPVIVRKGMSEAEKRNHARKLNALRRQMTKEQRNQLIVAMREDGMSYRQIGEAVGVSQMTAKRTVAESGVTNVTPATVTGADGKQYPATRPTPVRYADVDDGWGDPGLGVPVVEVDQGDEDDQDGAGAFVMKGWDSSAMPAQRPHVANNSGNNEWYTPEQYTAAARAVMGEITLDPASSELANTKVQASHFYTAEDDGLSLPWFGKVWLNPPYAAGLVDKFADKLADEYKAGEVDEAIVLVNNATETGWFASLVSVASAVCFPAQRIKYWSPVGELNTPLQGQAVLYVGANAGDFVDHFSKIGWCAWVA